MSDLWDAADKAWDKIMSEHRKAHPFTSWFGGSREFERVVFKAGFGQGAIWQGEKMLKMLKKGAKTK